MPVLDHQGHVVWRVKVSPNERTCCECGDTFPAGGICYRCGLMDDGRKRETLPPSVPTVEYLRDGEWERTH